MSRCMGIGGGMTLFPSLRYQYSDSALTISPASHYYSYYYYSYNHPPVVKKSLSPSRTEPYSITPS